LRIYRTMIDKIYRKTVNKERKAASALFFSRTKTPKATRNIFYTIPKKISENICNFLIIVL
jgi:hypothetical protein